jgi:hypothetical protein
MRLLLILAFLAGPILAQPGTLASLNHHRSIPDAHNCYPNEGRWANRIDRALKSGFPVGIEQDMAWYVDTATGKGRAVVSHSDKPRGTEPLLRDYFFERVRPIIEKALAENDRSHWPLIVLHFDFKSTQEPLLRAVWDLLGEYQGWITTAVKSSGLHELTPLDLKPLLVLTEEADAQEEFFFTRLRPGERLRLFGSAHTRAIPSKPKETHDRLLATMPPSELLSEKPTTYRRWWNSSWAAVEEGGPKQGGEWTADDDRRLRSLVDHAHELGYWIRFYTLDGFTEAENQGWDEGYDFGSRDRAALRWKAAKAAGVDIIATDQTEDLAPLLH